MRSATIRNWCTILLGAVAVGCSTSADRPGAKAASQDEEQVRQTFVAYQAALKARDGDKLWSLIDSDARADAEKAAKDAQAAYDKASPEEKPERVKAMGLTKAEMAKLTGPLFLKSNRFHGKYAEVEDSTIDKIEVQGDKATVFYTEPDQDKEKLTLVRQDGKWKVSVKMP